MRYRLAKPCDIKEIVNIHYSTREIYNNGIFSQLGKKFLSKYYRIVLNDKNEIVVCAEDEYGTIQGFCSSSLDVEKQYINIRKHKLQLMLAAISSIILNPSLVKALIDRYRSIKGTRDGIFINLKGARAEFWAWSTSNNDSISSIEMHEVQLNILRDLGVKELNFEVDIVNKNVFHFHKLNGAKIIDEMILPDGRIRALMRYNLVERRLRNL
jgi:hypothetical protein